MISKATMDVRLHHVEVLGCLVTPYRGTIHHGGGKTTNVEIVKFEIRQSFYEQLKPQHF